MARKNLTHLHPQPKYRRKKWAGSKGIPYTRDQALAEDQRRIGFVTRAENALGSPVGYEREKKMTKRLKRLRKAIKAATGGAGTPASAAYLFDCREPMLDQLTRLAGGKAAVVYVAALIPTGSRIPARNLKKYQGRLSMKRLRNHLDRAGGAAAAGWLVAGLHGEHDPDLDEYSIHYHVAFNEGMLPVLRALQGAGKYKIAQVSAANHTNRAAPILIQKVDPDDLRYTLSYVLQSFWPCRKWIEQPDGKTVHGRRRRIPEPRHTEWLLWMHTQTFQDLTLLYHLRVGRDGLEVNYPAALSANQ